MRIQTVEYRRLKNLGRYENLTIGATAAVEPGETAEQVTAALRAWVAEQLGEHPESGSAAEEYERLCASIRVVEQRKRDLDHEVQNLTRRVEEMRDQVKRAKAFIEQHGLELLNTPDDEIPF